MYDDVENGGGNQYQALWLAVMTTRSSRVSLALESSLTSRHDDQSDPSSNSQLFQVYITCHLKVAPANQIPDKLNKACSFNKTSQR